MGKWAVLMLVTEWLLLAQCFTVSDFITFVLASYACRLLVAQWYETSGIVDTRDTFAVSRNFFTATIYHGISWLWRYWYRHVSIDDKYRGFAGIAQHYIEHNHRLRGSASPVLTATHHSYYRKKTSVYHTVNGDLHCITHRKQQKMIKVILLRAPCQDVNVLLSNVTFINFAVFDVWNNAGRR